jgi:hypothetical protein
MLERYKYTLSQRQYLCYLYVLSEFQIRFGYCGGAEKNPKVLPEGKSCVSSFVLYVV